MRPSVYDEVTAKDTVVEDRDQVKVVFAGGNVFHIYVEGVAEHETKRGAKKTWERAETIRLDLNPDYKPPSDNEGESDPPEAAPPATGGEGASESPPEPEAPETDAGDETETGEGPEEVEEPEADEGETEEPDVFTKVRYGEVEGFARLVPVDVVRDLLADQAGRVALLQGGDYARRLARRVRATDGRCAPIFLTKVDVDDKDEVPALYDGLHTLAAAINLDMHKVCVVILPSGRVSEAQGMIAGLMYGALSTDADAEDEELTRRAFSD